MGNNTQKQGLQLNKLKRYKLIMDLYKQYKTDDIPTTTVWRKYICPVYPISRTTLYTILCSPVNKLLAELEKEKTKENE